MPARIRPLISGVPGGVADFSHRRIHRADGLADARCRRAVKRPATCCSCLRWNGRRSTAWPTSATTTSAATYVGYFDGNKCYKYSYSTNEPDRYFYPVSTTTTRSCSASLQQWSGNYLNWAATQTIDPFRKALTGGYRVKDTATETWLEKARYDGNGANSIYPDRRIPASGSDSTTVSGATPASWNNLTIRIWKLGNRMPFTDSGTLGVGLSTLTTRLCTRA